MSNLEQDDVVDRTLPGRAVPNGFQMRPRRDVPEAQLSSDARERVDRKIESVERARLRADQESYTAYVG